MTRPKSVSLLSVVLVTIFLLIVACQEENEVVTEEVTSQIEETASTAVTDSVEQAQIADAKLTMPTIFWAVKFYRERHTAEPASVEILEQEEFLALDSLSKQQWAFSLIFSEDSLITHIKAVSTESMKSGAGHEIQYDVNTGEFTIYGIAVVE